MPSRPTCVLIAVCCFATIASAQQTPPPKSVRPENLARHWVLINSSVEAAVPLRGKNMNVPGCAAVTFVVERNGRTSNVRVQKVDPPGDLAQVAASAAASLEFEPTMSNAGRDRVFSSLIFPFNLPADPDARTAVMERCVIEPVHWNHPEARPPGG